MSYNVIFLGNNEATLKSLLKCNVKIIAAIYEFNHDLVHTGGYDHIIKEKGGVVVGIPKDNKKELIKTVNCFHRPDLFLISYFTILPRELLSYPQKIINIHPSLLPQYKGAHPIQWALINSEKQIGVTFMTIKETVDEGEIYCQFPINIEQEDNQLTLFEKTNEVVDLHLCKIIAQVLKSEIVAKPQSGCGSYFPKLNKSNRYINFKKMTASDIHNLNRSQVKYGGVITTFKQIRIELPISKVINNENQEDSPSIIKELYTINNNQYCITVQCITGQIQFISNNMIFDKIKVGDCLGT